MKNLLPKRLIAFVLTLAILLSCVSLTILAADSGVATVAEVEDTLLLNRNFDDGKLLTNGLTIAHANGANDTITLGDSGDSYGKYISIKKNSSKSDAFIDIDTLHVDAVKNNGGSLVIQYDVKFSTYLNSRLSSAVFASLRRGDTGAVTAIIGLYGTSSFRGCNDSGSVSSSGAASATATNWNTVTHVITVASAGATTATVTSYVGSTAIGTTKSVEVAYMDRIRIGQPATSSSSNCQMDIDNISIMTTANTTASNAKSLVDAVASGNDGLLYDKFGDDIVDLSDYAGAMYLKVGADSGLTTAGAKFDTPAPVKIDGITYIPVSAIGNYFGLTTEVSGNTVTVSDANETTTYVFTVGSNEWTINGAAQTNLTRKVLSVNGEYPVFSADSIPAFGAYVSEVASGLIAIKDTENFITDDNTGYSTQIAIMKQFLFDHIKVDGSKYEAITADTVADLTHPYLVADADKFAELRAAYESSDSDPVLKSYLTALVAKGEKIYNQINTNGLDYYNARYTTNNGYDAGGRIGEAASFTNLMRDMAFAYQISGDVKYADLTYDMAVKLASWNHWGPGHMLNVADAGYSYALAYDWCYQAWTEAGKDTGVVRDALFTHVVLPGYYSVAEDICPWANPVMQSAYIFNTQENNQNAVVTAGMVTAALAIVNETGDPRSLTITPVYSGSSVPSHAPTTNGGATITSGTSYAVTDFGSNTNSYTTYQAFALYILNQSIFGLETYGLGQYVPDGSYLEGNGYWGYGTNNLFEAAASIISATGSDWGLMDTWGLDKTCYYVLNCMSGDFQSFNYHDSKTPGAMDTELFAFVAYALNDSNLVGVRKMMIDKGVSNVSLFDAVYYNTTTDYKLPALQYHMVGIDGYVVRDSWDSGSIYAGYIGNLNDAGHTQIDSGSFVYYSNGTRWFYDLDTYDYNAYDFGGSYRYSYYKMNAEGNNTLFLTSRQGTLPYGQALNGYGKITETGSNAHGAYSIMSQDGVYGTYANSAFRGLMMTNDRKTVVIQDEIEFATAESAVWGAHTQQDIILTSDGKTAFLSDGRTVVRVTLVTPDDNAGLRFEAMDVVDDNEDYSKETNNDSNSYFLNAIVSSTFSSYMGGTDLNTMKGDVGIASENYKTDTDNDLIGVKKLIVKCDNTASIKMAVVIEELAFGENQEVGYSWVDMASWTPTADGHQTDVTLSDNDFDESSIGDIVESDNKVNTSITEIDGNNAMTITAATAQQTGSTVQFKSTASKVVHGSIAQAYVTFELDITTDTAFPAGMLIAAYSNGGAFVSIPASECGADVIGKWTHLSFVLDTANHTMYVYADNKFVTAKTYDESVGYENLALAFVMPNGRVTEGSRVIVDNVLVRRFTRTGAAGTELAAVIANNSTMFNEWSYADENALRSSTPVAAVGNGEYVAGNVTGGNADGDTPTVNLEAKLYYTYAALLGAIKRGDTVTILASTPDYELNINTQCTVINRGYDIVVVSDTLLGYTDDTDSDVTVYKKGSVNVTLVTASGNTTVQVSSSRVADIDRDFGGARGDVTKVGDEYFVEAGIAADSAGTLTSKKDLVITDDNNTFYLANVPFDGAFIAQSGNNYVGGYSGDDLTAAFGVAYDSITLFRDIEVTASSPEGVSQAINLYLNGYTITYTGTENHMIINQKGDTTVTGPGKLVNMSSTSKNMFMPINKNLTITNVTMDSTNGYMFDIRGFATFTDCVINETKGCILSLTSNGYAYTPSLTLVGCTVNAGTTNAVSLNRNTTLTVTGGTVINANYAVLLGNSADTADDIARQSASFDDCTLNVNKLFHIGSVTTGNANFSDYANTMLAAVKFTGITNVKSTDIVNVSFTVSDVVYSYALSGAAIANQNNDSYPTAIAATGKYANVVWSANGTTNNDDNWVVGSYPVPNATAKANLAAMKVGDNKGTYPITAVSESEAAAGVKTITAASVVAFSIKQNLTLESGFDYNFYIEKTSGMTSVSFDGNVVASEYISEITLDGVAYYKVIIADIAPAEAAATHNLAITVSGGATVTVQVSILSYCRQILASDSISSEARNLMANVVRYIQASYKYFGKTETAEYADVTALVNQYKYEITCAIVDRQEADVSAVTDALTAATINVTGIPYFRFILNPEYTGNVSFAYKGTFQDGTENTITKTFIVENGLCDGKDYVEISIRACNLADDITITTAGGQAIYNLATFYHYNANQLNSDLALLLNAMYAYAEAAKIYKQTGSLS